jgi:uncharacterized protein (TIGR03437 family)
VKNVSLPYNSTIMRRIQIGILLFVLMTAVASAQPTVNAGGILNNASYATGIAQGSMFAVFGNGLGSSGTVNAFPIPTVLSGTSIRVTAGGTTKDALIVYTTPSQVGAILPSDTPVGSATLTVTFNGQTSAPAAFTVVRSNFGAFTNNQRGSGPAVVQNFNSQTDLARNGLTEAANWGQVVILWGTGLGPITGSDAGQPPVGDLDAAVQVLVGNQTARVIYKGRSGCCAGIDQIVFEVPQGVQGCYVPISVRVAGATPAQVATMSVAQTGKACTEPGLISAEDLERARTTGSLKVGSMLLIRYSFADSPQTFDLGMASFSRAKYAQLLSSLQRYVAAAPGQCEAGRTDGTTGGTFVTGSLGMDFFDDYLFFAGDDPLEAGDKINLTGGGQTLSLDKSSPGLYFGTLLNFQNPLQTFLTPGPFTVDNGAGGRDVSAFRTNITVPAPLRFDSTGTASIPRGRDLRVSWTGGSTNERVLVVGVSWANQGLLGGAFSCVQTGNAGSITVPGSILSVLPPSGNVQTGQGGGVLYLYSFSSLQRSQPGGNLDAFYTGTLNLAFRLADYQ